MPLAAGHDCALRYTQAGMARYRHFRNSDECGQIVFVTTTVLDFVHAFRRAEARDTLAFSLLKELRLEGATLFAYVVMPHHIHMIVRPRQDMNIRRLMQILKPRTGRAVSKLLSEDELKQFDQQRGLNGNTFWQRSFRSAVIGNEKMFFQKVRYIHMNPVKAGYVERPEEYKWSSAGLYASGDWSSEDGLDYKVLDNSLRTWPGGS